METMDPVLQAAHEATRRVAPDFVPRRRVAQSVKTHTVRGVLRGQPVVAKVLSHDAPHWRWYLEREIALYRAFERCPPPLRIPRLIAADEAAGALLLEDCRGRLLGRGRRAAARMNAELATQVAEALLRLADWEPPELPEPATQLPPRSGGRPLPDPLASVPWLEACVTRWTARELLDQATGSALRERLAVAPLELTFAHGDLLLRNVIQTRHERVYFDWEFAGRYPFGWDLGLLWVGLREAARDALEQAIHQLPRTRREQALLGAVLAAARELEVRRVSLHQGAGHPLVRDLVRDLALALKRWAA